MTYENFIELAKIVYQNNLMLQALIVSQYGMDGGTKIIRDFERQVKKEFKKVEMRSKK